LQGEIDVHLAVDEEGGVPHWVVLPMVVLSLTCEGVGLRILGSRRPILERGTSVTVRFQVGGRKLELPGRVAWHRARPDPARPCDLGIRLRLEKTRCGSTNAYADWVVDLVGRSMNREMELGVVLLQVARLSLETLQIALTRRKKTWRPVGEVLLEMNAITSYELRVAECCHLPFADESIPASLLEWQRSLALSAGGMP